jgi:hypothetical protein
MATAMHMSHPASVLLIHMLPWRQDFFMFEGMGIQFGRRIFIYESLNDISMAVNVCEKQTVY